ncbi:MAG: RsmB/NOP family class I SAM-dependent RNA methyltransferase, partial [Proteobacteria bacterium]|nr:RsmB/NOP family class I SAM-dependent RNA methyltransferase [Pseudomonadota bacterium]
MRSFDEHLKKIFGDELELYLNHPPVGDFMRVNPLRASTEQVMEVLQNLGFELERVPGLEDALQIMSMPFEPTQTIYHFAGWFVKQSLSSQLPVHYLDARPGQNILDMCAAPGSKTSQIATAMHNQGCLYANDLAGKRMTPLAARLDAMGVSHAVLYNMAAERLPHILPPFFDRVLADVPCSGLGHTDTMEENRWRYETARNPESQYQLQYRILVTGCKLLKPGGRIVYSTCSLNPDEDESVIHELLSRYPMKLIEMEDIPCVSFRKGITEFDGRTFIPEVTKTRRVTPWENNTQGFYVAVLEKTEEFDDRHRHIDPQAPIVETRDMNDPEIAAILENIQRYYGIDPANFRDFRFLLTPRAIYCLD